MSSILFISLMNEAAWGTSEELWYKSALYAATNGDHVACAFYHWDTKKDKVSALEKAGCQVFLLPNKGRQQRNFIEKIQYRLSCRSVRKTMDDIPINNYSTIVINVGDVSLFPEALSDWNKKLVNYHLIFQNYEQEGEIMASGISSLRNWILNATLNLFVCDSVKRNLEDKLNMHIGNAEIIINPITFVAPKTPTPFIKQPHYIFSMLAHMDIRRKGQDKLIRALACPKWLQRNFILTLYGDGKDRDRLENLIARKGLTKKVLLKPYPEDVKSVLEHSHLILRITPNDGIPVTILEALAMSRPIIVSPKGGMTHWVKNQMNGWVTRNDSVEEIEIALELAWNERTRWEHMGRKSFEIFSKQYPRSVEKRFLAQVEQQKEIPSAKNQRLISA